MSDYEFIPYSAGSGGGVSEAEVVQIVKTNFEGGVGYEEITQGEVIPETTVDGVEWGSQSPVYNFNVGDTYTVVFDGVSYTCVCKEIDVGAAGNCIGNASLFASSFEDTSEPFCFVTVPDQMTIGVFSDAGAHTFSVTGPSSTPVVIDRKFTNVVGWKGTGAMAEVFNVEANIASGDFSHAQGSGTTASGRNSHAQGQGTIASGRCSSAEGFYTIAGGQNQRVQGKYNVEDTENKYAHIVGNGESESERSNAHTLDWDGNAWFAGTVEGTELILKSYSGKRFKITVDDSGTITATAL